MKNAEFSIQLKKNGFTRKVKKTMSLLEQTNKKSKIASGGRDE